MPRSCPICTTSLPESFPGDLCPKCLLAGAVPVRSGSKEDDPPSELGVTQPVAAPHSDPNRLRSGGIPDVETLRGLFPDLEIHEILGVGGMGAVYKARQPRLDRLVALKIMVGKPDNEADFVLRFEREAQLLARLNHPHIVTIHDFGEVDGVHTSRDPLFYFIMEHVDGTDLAQLIRSGEIKAPQALAIVPQICEALQYAHDQGITHRDIKPANILIDKNGTVKIADFGLAKMIGGHDDAPMTGLTQTGTAMGTPHYMAPEQWENPDLVDHRADIYALGVVFYEMLTGERPAGVFEPPSRKADDVDRKLDGVVLRAMDKNPERRYQRAAEVRDDVTRISGVNKSSGTSAVKKAVPVKRLAALVAVTPLAVAGWMLWPKDDAETSFSKKPVPAIKDSPRPWTYPWPDLTRFPGLIDTKDGWVLSDRLNVIAQTDSGGQLRMQNVGIRARMRFSEQAQSEAAQLILRRGSHGGDHFELRYYRSLGSTRPNQYQIRHWDHARRQSTMLASIEVAEDAHDAPEGFLLEFYAIGKRLHGRLNGVHSITADVPDESFVNAGELGFAQLSYCWLKDMEILNLDGLSEAETLRLAGTASVTLSGDFTHDHSR